MIIGITGTLGAGKGTVVEYLKSKGFTHYSSSRILKEILAERGLPATRTNMSKLSDELTAKQPGGVLHLSYERALKDGAMDFVFESIHRVSEAEYIRSIGGVVFGVDADMKKRYERAVKRKEGEKDNVTFEQFVSDTKREEEGLTGTGPNIRAVLKDAEAVLTNNGTQEELFAQVEKALQTRV
jgi:dephospho-CoA kinase